MCEEVGAWRYVQPYLLAGKGRGDEQDRSAYLAALKQKQSKKQVYQIVRVTDTVHAWVGDHEMLRSLHEGVGCRVGKLEGSKEGADVPCCNGEEK